MAFSTPSKLLNFRVWPWLFGLVGVCISLYQFLGFNLAGLPGDLGDGRLNNYFLEHGYLWLCGRVGSFWNAPFMFPEANTMAYSDNLLGSLPMYAFFRAFGFDRETAFQFWYIGCNALNFVGAYFALRLLQRTVYSASLGAWVYAFGLPLFLASCHAQLMPRFAVPLIIAFWILFIKEKKLMYWYSVLGLLVWQFYCGIYLGYFVIYCLIGLTVSALFFENGIRIGMHVRQLNVLQNGLKLLSSLIIALVCLAPLFYPYLKHRERRDFPNLSETISMLPTGWSHLFPPVNTLIWEPLRERLIPFFQDMPQHEHFIFVGAVTLLSAFMAWFWRRQMPYGQLVLPALILLVLLVFKIGPYPIYIWWAKYVPGAMAIRAVARFGLVLLFLVVIGASGVWDVWLQNQSNRFLKYLIMALLPIFLILDNWQNERPFAAVKTTAQKRVYVAKEAILKHWDSQKYKAVLLVDSSFSSKTLDVDFSVHLDGMLACQELGIPTINAYTASYPDSYWQNIYVSFDAAKLGGWLQSEYVKRYQLPSISPEHICVVYYNHL